MAPRECPPRNAPGARLFGAETRPLKGRVGARGACIRAIASEACALPARHAGLGVAAAGAAGGLAVANRKRRVAACADPALILGRTGTAAFRQLAHERVGARVGWDCMGSVGGRIGDGRISPGRVAGPRSRLRRLAAASDGSHDGGNAGCSERGERPGGRRWWRSPVRALSDPVLRSSPVGDPEQVARLVHDHAMPHAARHHAGAPLIERDLALLACFVEHHRELAGEQHEDLLAVRVHLPVRPVGLAGERCDEPPLEEPLVGADVAPEVGRDVDGGRRTGGERQT